MSEVKEKARVVTEPKPANALTIPAESGAIVVADSGSIMAKVMELASTPGANPEMFDRLVAWQEREQTRQAGIEYNMAMNLAQEEIRPVARRHHNSQTNSNYAKFEDIDEAIRPVYIRHGFSLSWNNVESIVPGNVRVACRCAHVAGHHEMFFREAPPDTAGPKGGATKTVLHGTGSTETYLKTIIERGIFNVPLAEPNAQMSGSGEVISDEDAEFLRDLCVRANRQEGTILHRMFEGKITSFNEIPPGAAFLAVKNMLSAMVKQAPPAGGK